MGPKIADRLEWKPSPAVEIFENVMPIKRKINYKKLATKLIEM